MSQFGLSNRFQTFEKMQIQQKCVLVETIITYLFESSFEMCRVYFRQKELFSVHSSILGPLSNRIIEKHLQ